MSKIDMHRMNETMMDRYWINQPSTLQKYHDLHGSCVLAPRDLTTEEGEVVTVYFSSGNIISSRVHKIALSKGWPIKQYSLLNSFVYILTSAIVQRYPDITYEQALKKIPIFSRMNLSSSLDEKSFDLIKETWLMGRIVGMVTIYQGFNDPDIKENTILNKITIEEVE